MKRLLGKAFAAESLRVFGIEHEADELLEDATWNGLEIQDAELAATLADPQRTFVY